ncbi:hypothetical protein KFE25_009976 [Diacronema lutheri]|uniref:U1 small nuclear ribonucleoprotein C n=2 Tax=Diacronema lutheri TaxID=2081491 RepID=A0A8J5XHW8_DIALT|nr:hypothetical protein KFE25_009976 [Diacronema lutheri]
MPRFYCEYCEIFLTHSSAHGRRQHSSGRKHIMNVIDYYADFQLQLRETTEGAPLPPVGMPLPPPLPQPGGAGMFSLPVPPPLPMPSMPMMAPPQPAGYGFAPPPMRPPMGFAPPPLAQPPMMQQPGGQQPASRFGPPPAGTEGQGGAPSLASIFGVPQRY